jgi:hypothetical protein
MAMGQNFRYIGAPKCKPCHNKPQKGEQYNVWSQGPHAPALKTLSSEKSMQIAKERGIADPTKDPGCLKCHATTGHVEQSLYAGIRPTEGVSCESCHGPGSRYKAANIMKSREMSMKNGLILPTEEVCVTCHNPESPTYVPFDYAKKVALIAHPDPTLK